MRQQNQPQAIQKFGVSLLTSLDENDTSELYGNSFDDQFTKLITLAKSSSVDGIVCSPKKLISLHDLNKIKVVPASEILKPMMIKKEP